ncbi:MAG: hypothetical protein U0792_07750 [Gemmataceae bacterium]
MDNAAHEVGQGSGQVTGCHSANGPQVNAKNAAGPEAEQGVRHRHRRLCHPVEAKGSRWPPPEPFAKIDANNDGKLSFEVARRPRASHERATESGDSRDERDRKCRKFYA